MTPRPKKIASALVAALAAVTMLGAGSAAAQTPPKPTPITSEASVADSGMKSMNGSFGVISKASFKPRR